MRDSIDLYKLIVENLPGGVWVSDQNDVIIYADEAMCNMAGVPCSEIIGKSVERKFRIKELKDRVKELESMLKERGE